VRNLVVFIFLIISSQALAKHEIGISSINLSTTLTGTDKTTRGQGVLASNSNFFLGFSYTWFMTPRFHFRLNYYSRKFKFIEDGGNIEGDDEIDSNLQEVGLRYVAHRLVAFSILNVSETDVAFIVNSNNRIELVSSSLSFIRLMYHQMFYSGQRVNIGMDLMYDISSSTDLIKNRNATGADLFMIFGKSQGKMKLYAGTRIINKETDGLEFEQNDILIGANFTYLF
jgi:hypothetical protein